MSEICRVPRHNSLIPSTPTAMYDASSFFMELFSLMPIATAAAPSSVKLFQETFSSWSFGVRLRYSHTAMPTLLVRDALEMLRWQSCSVRCRLSNSAAAPSSCREFAERSSRSKVFRMCVSPASPSPVTTLKTPKSWLRVKAAARA